MRSTHLRFMLTCLLLGLSHLPVAGQQTKYGVTVKAAKPAALAKARTYVWTTGRPTFSKPVDGMIVAAVDRELMAKGFTKRPSAPADMEVSYEALARTDVDPKAKPSTDGTLPEISVGMLGVDLRDPTSRAQLFSVRMDTPIERDLATIEASIDAAVKAMFEVYPQPKR